MLEYTNYPRQKLLVLQIVKKRQNVLVLDSLVCIDNYQNE